MIEKYPGDSNRQIARRCGYPRTQVGSVREKMNEPSPEQKTFAEFSCKTWDALFEPHRVSLCNRSPRLLELLTD